MPKMTPEVKHLLMLMGPAMLTGGVIQINMMIGRIIASGQDGAISLLQLCRPYQPIAAGCRWHCHRCRLAAGTVARFERRAALTRPTHLQNRSLEFALVADLAGRSRHAGDAGANRQHPVRARRIHQRNNSTDRLGAGGICLGLPAYVLIKVFPAGHSLRAKT